VSVPRKPVDQVTEQRVTLGEKERQLLEQVVQQERIDADLALILDVAKAAFMPLAILGAGYGIYLGMTNWATGLDPIKDAAEAAAAASGLTAFQAGLATQDPETMTPEQIQALANANLNPLFRGLAGYGIYGGLLRRAFGL